ncbi:hypothetical protein BsWGS_00036 [Bradybaena similaris]
MSAMWTILHAYQYAQFPPLPFPRMPSALPPWPSNAGLMDDGSRDRCDRSRYADESSDCLDRASSRPSAWTHGMPGFEDSSAMEHMAHHYRSLAHSPTDSLGCGKARKNKEDKYCGVCGDRALGYNFDAISCESCKAFFRRNAPKGLEYFKCPYEEKCKMDVSNRRFCKRCRLRKCFEIGMRKEYILTDEEKMRKRQRIEENRHKTTGKPLDCKFREVDKTKMQQSMDISSSAAPRLRVLEPEEEMAINEIVSAYHQSLEICVESEVSRNQPSMIELVNIAEISVRRVIDMSKKIKSFKALSQSDQISLLKGGSIELLIIRSVITFDSDKMQFLDPYDKEKYAMTTDQLKMGQGTGLFDEHMRFVKSLAVDLQADETVLILLLMIALYSPDRPQIVDKHYVAEEQERYALLLLRYLESKHPAHVIRWMYPKLLMKLTDIRNLNEEHSQVLLKINPEGIQPLMKEVLDLNAEKNKLAKAEHENNVKMEQQQEQHEQPMTIC